ncbi:MAG: RAD55 family ATPase [Candidatus Thorarchaeota archaeon]
MLKKISQISMNRYSTGISALDRVVPSGFPTNAFAVIRGPGGGGKSAILNEIAVRMMRSGKRVIYVCFEDTPLCVLENMVSIGFDASSLEAGVIHFVDCFSNQVLKRQTPYEYSTLVADPTDPDYITKSIQEAINRMDPARVGGVFADSLTELFFQSHPFKAVNAFKAWRALFCKEQSIPFWATYHTGLQQFAAYDDMITYSSDIILDTRHEPAFQKAGALIKQFRVTKVKGAPHKPVWVMFEVGTNGIESLSLDEIRSIAKSITRIESPDTE